MGWLEGFTPNIYYEDDVYSGWDLRQVWRTFRWLEWRGRDQSLPGPSSEEAGRGDSAAAVGVHDSHETNVHLQQSTSWIQINVWKRQRAYGEWHDDQWRIILQNKYYFLGWCQVPLGFVQKMETLKLDITKIQKSAPRCHTNHSQIIFLQLQIM